MRAFAENLFGATELMAKGLLLMLPDKNILRSKKHEYLSSQYNWWGKMGSADPRYVNLLNRLSNLRGSARYLDKDFSLSQDEAKEMLNTAEDMYETLRNSTPQRYRLSSDS
jgi:hypothetical protein